MAGRLDLQQFSKHNDDVMYILTVIDILSKHAWTIFLKGKTGSEIAGAFKTIFSRGRKPQITDRVGKRILKPAFKQAVKAVQCSPFCYEL